MQSSVVCKVDSVVGLQTVFQLSPGVVATPSAPGQQMMAGGRRGGTRRRIQGQESLLTAREAEK